MSISFFVPAKSARCDAGELKSLLSSLANNAALTPFDDTLVNFVTDFAKSILLEKKARAYPELIVLANFFKSGNIARLKNELRLDAPSLYLSRGLVFHMAPSNVDSVFLYSSLLSLLCGNINIIRISRQSGDQVDFILEKLLNLLSKAHSGLANRFFVVTYDHDDAITSLISEYCHMRVVWGGDATVKRIRSLPLRATASEICFSDRFSAAMLQADAVLGLPPSALNDLCARFFNDAIWFSQQACSSPRLVSWIGSIDACAAARQRFWEAFALQLQDQAYENTPGMVMDRFVTSCMVATNPMHRETMSLSFPTRILLSSESLGTVKHYHCGNGLFYEQCFASVPEFFLTLTDREQTLSIFGFEAELVAQCLRDLPLRSIDRVTKIGNALDFSHIWDGYNLLHAFTRQIAVSP